MNPLITSNTEGVYLGLDARAYHSAPGVSSTMLRSLARSPAHMLAAFDDKRDTAAMVFGRIVHQLVLEPAAPPWWVVAPPGLDLRKKEGKEWKAAREGYKVVKQDEWADITGAVNALQSNLDFAAELAHSRTEVSVFRKFTLGGTVLRRGRIDMVCAGACLADIKTTEDARPEAFSRHVLAMGYHIQAAYYLDLWNSARPDDLKTGVVLAAVEKEPPYAVALYALDQQAIELGRSKYIDLLVRYMDCAANNHWPAYAAKVTTLNLPAWAYKQTEFLNE